MPKRSKPEHRRPFTPEQRALLVRHYRKHTVVWLAAHVKRSYWATLDELYRLSRQGLVRIGRNRKWEAPEQEYLEVRYGLTTDSVIARRLHRSEGAIRQRALKTGLTRKSNFLTASEVARILGVSPATIVAWMRKGKLHGRKSNVVGVGRYACWHIDWADLEIFLKEEAGLYDIKRIDPVEYKYWRNLAEQHVPRGQVPKMPRDWTPEEDAFILNNHKQMSNREIGEHLRRSKEAVHYRTGILRARGHLVPYNFPWNNTHKRIMPRQAWTPEEDELIRANWGRERTPEEIEAIRSAGKRLWGTRITSGDIARALGRTQQACESRASRLGVNNPGWNTQDEGAA